MLVSDFFQIDPDLIRRFGYYDASYRVYPEIRYFTEAFDSHAYSTWLGHHKTGRFCRTSSLYIHLPFDLSLRYYCYLNQIKSADEDSAKKYCRYLLREIELQGQLFKDAPIVEQLYFGGAPVLFNHAQLNSIIRTIDQNFNLMKDGKYCIEIDSRQISKHFVPALREMGFNFIVIVVQDFDQHMHRSARNSQIKNKALLAIRDAHHSGFKTIRIELFYGLPNQDLEDFAYIVEKIIAADPHQINLLSYHHQSSQPKLQKSINLKDSPSENLKCEMLLFAHANLTDAGYIYIGMGLFVKSEDPLVNAKRQGSRHYGMQGYSLYPENCCVGLGISSVGCTGPMLNQNTYNLRDYCSKLERNILPVWRGIELNSDDLMRRSVIQALISHSVLSIESVETFFPIDFKNYFSKELTELAAYARAGLIALNDDEIVVTPKGQLLISNICAVFDNYLRTSH
ncbi:MAG: oxygen-independent coproporphyrinogen III oxidase [Nitrosomonas sp.]|nr:MAG: oxygen-independent coproporphyrinogen III oxidase [Nitrosomonas sp.]